MHPTNNLQHQHGPHKCLGGPHECRAAASPDVQFSAIHWLHLRSTRRPHNSPSWQLKVPQTSSAQWQGQLGDETSRECASGQSAHRDNSERQLHTLQHVEPLVEHIQPRAALVNDCHHQRRHQRHCTCDRDAQPWRHLSAQRHEHR
jgi:hypothetical protein